MLTYIEWPTGEAIRTAADVDPDVLLALAFASGPIASLLAIPGILCLLGYRLNRAKTAEIQAQLAARAA